MLVEVDLAALQLQYILKIWSRLFHGLIKKLALI